MGWGKVKEGKKKEARKRIPKKRTIWHRAKSLKGSVNKTWVLEQQG